MPVPALKLYSLHAVINGRCFAPELARIRRYSRVALICERPRGANRSVRPANIGQKSQLTRLQPET